MCSTIILFGTKPSETRKEFLGCLLCFCFHSYNGKNVVDSKLI
jgi:hypothetical protein